MIRVSLRLKMSLPMISLRFETTRLRNPLPFCPFQRLPMDGVVQELDSRGPIAISQSLMLSLMKYIRGCPDSPRPPWEVFIHGCAEAIRIITDRGSGATEVFWRKQLARLHARARLLSPVLQKVREAGGPDCKETRVRAHVPLLKELPPGQDAGWAEWRDQFVSGFPTLGKLGGLGVCPPRFKTLGILSREDLLASASSRFVPAKRWWGPRAEELRQESLTQVEKNWLCGPHRYSFKREPWAGGGPIAANPAFRSGAQQVDKL